MGVTLSVMWFMSALLMGLGIKQNSSQEQCFGETFLFAGWAQMSFVP